MELGTSNWMTQQVRFALRVRLVLVYISDVSGSNLYSEALLTGKQRDSQTPNSTIPPQIAQLRLVPL